MAQSNTYRFPYILLGKPGARSVIRGSAQYPEINGTVNFYPADNGTLIEAEVFSLPRQTLSSGDKPPVGPFGFHLHEGNTCENGHAAHDSFESARGHYNPTNEPHPLHAGDFPVLFSNNGYAYMVFYTNRFKPSDIINKTVIVHENPDDYRTQPAGASGKRIACGVVKKA